MKKYAVCRDKVLSYLRDNHRSEATIIKYQRILSKFEKYLLDSKINVSTDRGDQWINTLCIYLRSGIGNEQRTVVLRLKDIMFNGCIVKRHSESRPSATSELCDVYQEILDSAMVYGRENRVSLFQQKMDIYRVLLWLQEKGINNPADITYDDLFYVLDHLKNQTKSTCSSRLRILNNLLLYLYMRGLVSYGFTLFTSSLHGQNNDATYWHIERQSDIENLLAHQKNIRSFSLSEYILFQRYLIELHKRAHYSHYHIRAVRHCTDVFYLFLDRNGLLYTPEAADLFLEYLEPVISHALFNYYHRTMLLLKQISNFGRVDMHVIYSYQKRQIDCLPDWCREIAKKFCEMKVMEGWALKTIDMFEASVSRFCTYLTQKGITSFEQIDSTLIKQFNICDKHSTPASKNAYNSRIRMFLDYLGEHKLTNNRYLFLALTNVAAPCENLVVTLTDEEQSLLGEKFADENSSISLRAKAIIQLGLYMGIRRCDIVSLRFNDIDWQNSTISFVQSKTSYGMSLPMPDQVANALYQYIMEERPESECDTVFVQNKAPFESVSSQVCTSALNRALPQRNVYDSGFHVTRKTFATNLIKNKATAEEVMETLGHRNLSNIRKYLSLDDQNMIKCPFSLIERDLRYEGGFPNEQ